MKEVDYILQCVGPCVIYSGVSGQCSHTVPTCVDDSVCLCHWLGRMYNVAGSFLHLVATDQGYDEHHNKAHAPKRYTQNNTHRPEINKQIKCKTRDIE